MANVSTRSEISPAVAVIVILLVLAIVAGVFLYFWNAGPKTPPVPTADISPVDTLPPPGQAGNAQPLAPPAAFNAIRRMTEQAGNAQPPAPPAPSSPAQPGR